MLQFVYKLSAEIRRGECFLYAISTLIDKNNTHSGSPFPNNCLMGMGEGFSAGLFTDADDAGDSLAISLTFKGCTNNMLRLHDPKLPHAGAAFHLLDHIVTRSLSRTLS